jgi:hypothetical protein
MIRILGGAVSAATLFVVFAGDGDPVQLTWNFAKGDRFFVERIVKQKQTIEAKKRSFGQETTSHWLSSVLVRDKTADGYILDLQIEKVERSLNDLASKKTINDSLADRMKGAKFTLTMTTQGKITKLDGYEDFVKQLLADHKADDKIVKKEDLEKTLRTLVSSELIQSSLEEVFAWIPGQPVRKGKPWKHQVKEPLGAFGHFLSTYDLTYEGDKDGRRQASANIAVSFIVPPEEIDLIKVHEGKIKAEEGKASYSLASDGKSLEATKKVVVKGVLDVEVSGNRNTLSLVSETSLTMRVFAK